MSDETTAETAQTPAPVADPNSVVAALFASLGVKDEAEIKAALQAQRDRAAEIEAAKATAEAAQKQVTDLTATLKAQASSVMSGLTESQRNAVAAVAGDDPSKVIATVAALRPTWASHPATTTTAAAPAAQPAPEKPTQKPDNAAKYRSLQTSNPFAAAAFLLKDSSFL